jgi:hypothetical protein
MRRAGLFSSGAWRGGKIGAGVATRAAVAARILNGDDRAGRLTGIDQLACDQPCGRNAYRRAACSPLLCSGSMLSSALRRLRGPR